LLAAWGSPRFRRASLAVAGVLLAAFLAIYFVPGWVLEVRARNGDAEAQYVSIPHK
jgi:hypothetical protein